MPWFLWDLRASTFLSVANMLVFAWFAMYCAPDLLNSLFDSAKRVDRSMHFHFQVHALLISDKSTLEQKTLILGGDQHALCSIISTTTFRDNDRTIFRRQKFVFRIATLGVNRQLLIQDGLFGCRLVLLTSMYMENCVIASTNISPLQDFCTEHLKVTGKRMPLVRSRILPSPILFKKVIATKNPCSLDDFLVAKYFIK